MFWRNKRKIDFSWVSSDSRFSEKITLKCYNKLQLIDWLKIISIFSPLCKISIFWTLNTFLYSPATYMVCIMSTTHRYAGPQVHTSSYMHDWYSVHIPQSRGPQLLRHTWLIFCPKPTGQQVHTFCYIHDRYYVHNPQPTTHRSLGPQVNTSY